MKSQIRREKIIQIEIKKIDHITTILNDLIDDMKKLNINNEKKRKHYPFLLDDDKYIISMDDGQIFYKSNDLTAKKHYLFDNGGNSHEKSFTFSDVGIDIHIKHIIDQLSYVKNRYNAMLMDQMEFKYYNIAEDMKNNRKYFDIDGRQMYDECYTIGVTPIGSFIIDTERNIGISTNYVIAHGNNDKWNIFFDYDSNSINEGCGGMKQFIDEFNNTCIKYIDFHTLIIILKKFRKLYSKFQCGEY